MAPPEITWPTRPCSLGGYCFASFGRCLLAGLSRVGPVDVPVAGEPEEAGGNPPSPPPPGTAGDAPPPPPGAPEHGGRPPRPAGELPSRPAAHSECWISQT